MKDINDEMQEIVTHGYLRPKRHLKAYAILKENIEIRGYCENGLPIPPLTLWIGYGTTDNEYLSSGARHIDGMLAAVTFDGFDPFLPSARILDFGCGGGRMLRHLVKYTGTCRIYGTDISGDHILWLKQYLSSNFTIFQNTTIPHLPLESASFRLIYCGSVFTHIDDLSDSWLLELQRILSEEGRLYITVHDEHTLEFLNGKNHRLTNIIANDIAFRQYSNKYNMLVIQRGAWSQVFYNQQWLKTHLHNIGFRVLNVIPLSYGYQTGYVLQKRI